MTPQQSFPNSGPSVREVDKRLRLQALKHQLARLGLHSRLIHHHARRWCLHVRAEEHAACRVEVVCAGAHGVFVLLTTDGDLLGCADEHGTRLAAEQIAALLPPAAGEIAASSQMEAA